MPCSSGCGVCRFVLPLLYRWSRQRRRPSWYRSQDIYSLMASQALADVLLSDSITCVRNKRRKTSRKMREKQTKNKERRNGEKHDKNKRMGSSHISRGKDGSRARDELGTLKIQVPFFTLGPRPKRALRVSTFSAYGRRQERGGNNHKEKHRKRQNKGNRNEDKKQQNKKKETRKH